MCEAVLSGKDRYVILNDKFIGKADFFQVYQNHFVGEFGQQSQYINFDTFEEIDSLIVLTDNYYIHNGIQAWDIIDKVMDYYEGEISNRDCWVIANILKYLLRFKFKGQEKEDIDKIIKYCKKLAEG